MSAGWRARPARPCRLLPPFPEIVTVISGLLVAPPGVGLKLENPAWREGAAPPRLVHLDLPALEGQLGIALAPAVLLLDPEHPFGLERRWRALPNTLPPERHRGYALQWFGLAATVAVVTAVLARRGAHA
ncbi:MAG: SURF1 family cytochrome oxidase biogenesis protein [Xanthomonadales bacterium]|nr:SURF1 family cytochrome oxidase biogenesis protein [Xanthomonadales bacterium]